MKELSPASTVPPLSDKPDHQPLDARDAAAMSALVAGVVLIFWKVVVAGQVFCYRDVLNQSYPEAKFVRHLLRRGVLPMWNRYLNFGQPQLANPNALVFYPTTLLMALLPLNLGYSLHFVLHFAWMALGAYLLARQWGQSRVAALAAGAVFVLSGPVLSLGSFYNQIAAAAWVPWALWATDRALEKASARRWAWLAAIFALQFLGGEPFTFIATFMLCFAYAVHQRGTWKKFCVPSNRTVFLTFVAVGLLALGLAAMQLIPGLILLQDSLRGAMGMPYGQVTYWSLCPLSLLDMVMPAFFGPMFTTPSMWAMVLNFGNRAYFPSLFVGFVPFFLAAVGWRPSQGRARNFAGWAAVGLLLLSFGRFTPLFALAYLVFPPLQLVRFPIKLLVPFALLVAMLAGWGIDDLRENSDALRRRAQKLLRPLELLLGLVAALWLAAWLAPTAVIPLAAWLLRWSSSVATSYYHWPQPTLQKAGVYALIMLRLHLPELLGYSLGGAIWLILIQKGHRWARKALPLAVVVALSELLLANYGVNPTVPGWFYAYHPPVLDHAQPSPMPYRFAVLYGSSALVTVTTNQAQPILNFQSIPLAQKLSPLAQSEFQERLLLEDGGMVEGVESISNVDVDLSFPPQMFVFWVYAASEARDPSEEACMLGRANVRYQIIGHPLDLPTLRRVASVFNGTSEPSYLYENRCFLPRAYVAGQARFAPSASEVLASLSSPNFDAARIVFLDRRSDSTPPAVASPTAAGQIDSFTHSPNEVRLEATLTEPGYVVLLDRFARGWHATLDGHPVPILRANLLFRAVRVGPGTHTINFTYRTPGLRLGLAITLLSVLFLLAMLILNPTLTPF